MDLDLTHEQELIRDTVRSFARERVALLRRAEEQNLLRPTAAGQPRGGNLPQQPSTTSTSFAADRS